MIRDLFLLTLICLPVWGQNGSTPELQAQAAVLRTLVAQAPKLALERTQIKIQPPRADWELGYPSAVTMDAEGAIYVLQRGEKSDPVLVLNREG